MSCPIKQKLIVDLVDKQAITENNVILNFSKFNNLNELYTNTAKLKYGFDTYGKNLFDVDEETSTIIPNNDILSLYDDIVKEYEKEHIITKQDNIIIKEGIDTIFENNPELSEIGTQEEYSKYLDTIFPESKVKDIVYHGSDVNIDKFSKEFLNSGAGQMLGSGFYFATTKDKAKFYTETVANKELKSYNPSIINIINPKEVSILSKSEDVAKTAQDGNIDNKSGQYVVFEPEQIHILGSEQDIENFKQFIDFESNNILVSSKSRITELLDENTDDFLSIVEGENTVNEVKENNPINFILFNNEDKSFTAKEVLDNIKTNYKGFNKFTNILIEKLLPLLYKTNAKIKFVAESRLKNFNTVMQYDPSTNTIEINKERLLEFTPAQVVSSLLHEIVHSVTIKAYTRPESMNEKMFKDFINKMYTKYKLLSTNKSYGFKNQEEFIAELMTNEEFQLELMGIEENGKSLWTQIVDYIRTLLGLPKNSDYTKLINSITKVIQESDYEGGINEGIYESREPRTYYSLKTIEERQTYLLNGIKDNLEESIRRYDHLIKVIKDPTKLKKYSDNLKKLFADIDVFDNAKKWEAISIFTHSMIKNINSLETAFDKEDLTADSIKNTIALYQKYLTAHSLIHEVLAFISEMGASNQTLIKKEDILTLKKELGTAMGKYTTLTNDIESINKKGVIKVLNNRKYAGKVLAKWKQKLEKQHFDLQIPEGKTAWVSKMMNTTYADEIDKEVEDYANSIVYDIHFDISLGTKLFVSGISTNSKLVQIMQNLINGIRENIIRRDRDNDFKLKSIFDKWSTEKKGQSPSKAYAKLLEYDAYGRAYLKGEVKLEFKLLYEKKLAEYTLGRDEVIVKFGKNSREFRQYFTNSEFKKWILDNTHEIVNEKGTRLSKPNKEWLNNLEDLSEVEKEALLTFRQISLDTKKQTFGIHSIVSKPLFGSVFYNLPSITKSNLERVIEGNATGIATDAWKDLTTIRPDDVGYETIKQDLAGNPIYDVKINFRGKIEPSQQSLDLFTVYRLEAKNGVNFDEKHQAENSMTSLVEIAKNKEYYKTTGSRVPFVNLIIRRNKTARVKGAKSETYERLVSLMESNLYDILHKDAGSIGGVDMNKAVGVLNGWTAKLGMWINEVAGSVNVLNGKAQLFLEGLAGNHISGSALMKAEKLYFADALNNLKDMSSPIKMSRTNQINEMFDTFGMVSVSVEQAFIKNTLAKAKLNSDSMQFMQASGEHWLQSVLTMGVLETIKVLDADSNFIDVNGNIVDEKNAASLLDMLDNSKGQLALNNKVVYTTKSLGIKYNEGGKEIVNNFLKAKIFQTMGNYDSNMQPEAMRHATGKIFMMFRKYLVESALNRWRGFVHVGKAKDELLEEERFFSDALQEDIEGMYTTTIRYFIKAVLPALKEMNFKLLSSNWNELSDSEKKNIQKTIAEAGLNILLFKLAILLSGLAGDGDDDDSVLWYTALVAARLNSELMSYIDPRQQYKILKSPIPSMRVVESLTSILGTAITPWSVTDKDSKGNLVIVKDLKSLTPIINLKKTTYKQKYQYINYITN